MKLMDVKCNKCGKVHSDVLVSTGERPAPDDGCDCGNMDSFTPIIAVPRHSSHSTWKVDG